MTALDGNLVLCIFSDRQAFDQHLNMVLGDVEESVTARELDEETEEEIVKVRLQHVSPSL